MILIKLVENRWEFWRIDRACSGKLLEHSCLATTQLLSDLPDMLVALVRDEIADYDDNGVDPSTGYPAVSPSAEEQEEFLIIDWDAIRRGEG
jgi:hypothetical protein